MCGILLLNKRASLACAVRLAGTAYPQSRLAGAKVSKKSLIAF